MATLLLKIVYYLAIFCTHASLSFVKAQNLQIQVQPPSVTLRQDDLVVTCSIIRPSQLDIVYYMQLEKNNSDTMKNVVSVRSSNGQDVTTWQDSDLQNRASVIGTVSSPATSQLKLTIPKDRVQCPQDFTGYKCTMSGFSTGLVNQETSQMYASYIAYPTVIEMPTVRILGEFSDTPTREFPVGTAIQLTCTGQIGSDASATIRWCAKKSQDFTMTGLPQTPIHSQATPTSGCQYTRSSTITYNLTSDDTYTQFLCESGYSGLCETGKAKQYLNITLDTYAPQINDVRVYGGSVVNETMSFTLYCSITSPASTNISIMNLNTSEIVTFSSNTLSLNYTEESARCSQTASYICIAQNAVGMSESSLLKIYVKCEPRSFNGLSYKQLFFHKNDSLDLSAVHIAYPQPSYVWTFRRTSTGPRISLTADFNITVTTINITTFSVKLQRYFLPEEFFGYYTVVAKNEHGSFATIFHVNPQGIPDAPTNVSMFCSVSRSAFVSWVPGFDGGSPQTFIVSYRTSTEKQLNTSRVSEVSLVIPNLLNGEMYSFRVIAINRYGSSPSVENSCYVPGQSGNNSENLSIIYGSLFGVFFCLCAGLVAHIFFYKITKKYGKCVGKHDKDGDYVMQNISGSDDHQYQGIDADCNKTGHQMNSAQYDVLGSRDPANVYGRVGDINASIVVMQSYGDKK